MYETPPNSENAGLFSRIEDIFYGSDDGHPDVSFKEMEVFEQFYKGVAAERRRRIHFMSVVGGFYGLNFISLFRPKEITLFDINPYQIVYANLIIRVLIASQSAEVFMYRLTNQDYQVQSIAEEFIRESIAIKQNGFLPQARGRSKRSLSGSWQYALDRFDVTKQVLSEARIQTMIGGMQEESFQDYIYTRPNLWIYTSNVFLFVFFKLRFLYPGNAAMLAMYHAETELLDLAGSSDGPVEVECRIPMSASRINGSEAPDRQILHGGRLKL